MGFNRACSFAGAATSLIRSVQRRSRCSLRSFRYFCQARPMRRRQSVLQVRSSRLSSRVVIDYVLTHRLM
jgi:hypothetical protein